MRRGGKEWRAGLACVASDRTSELMEELRGFERALGLQNAGRASCWKLCALGVCILHFRARHEISRSEERIEHRSLT